jgi:hypothetical protein
MKIDIIDFSNTFSVFMSYNQFLKNIFLYKNDVEIYFSKNFIQSYFFKEKLFFFDSVYYLNLTKFLEKIIFIIIVFSISIKKKKIIFFNFY